MADETLTRFLDRFAPPPEESAVEEAEPETDAGAFGYLRGVRDRALMLELRLRDGNVVALSYALLDRADFDPSDGIRLRFAGQEVVIRGRRLQDPIGGVRLFDMVCRHRATWLREGSRSDSIGETNDRTHVDAIRLD